MLKTLFQKRCKCFPGASAAPGESGRGSGVLVGQRHIVVCSVVDLYIRSIYDPVIGSDIREAAAKVLCKVWLDQDDEVDEWKYIQQLDHSISALDPDHISLKFYVLLEALENNALHSLKQFCDVIQKWGIIRTSDSVDDDVELVRSNEYGRWIECVVKVLQSGINFVKNGDLEHPSNEIDMVGVRACLFWCFCMFA